MGTIAEIAGDWPDRRRYFVRGVDSELAVAELFFGELKHGCLKMPPGVLTITMHPESLRNTWDVTIHFEDKESRDAFRIPTGTT